VIEVSSGGDLTITPSGGNVAVDGKLGATVFDGPIGTGAATPAAIAGTTGAFSGAVTAAGSSSFTRLDSENYLYLNEYSTNAGKSNSINLRKSHQNTVGLTETINNEYLGHPHGNDLYHFRRHEWYYSGHYD